MSYLIPVISGLLYRAGGAEWGNKWYRWAMGVPIAIITGNWWYALTYYLATAVFVYGDSSWVSKLVGRKGARAVHGFAFGLASLDPWFALWTMITFYVLFWIAERGVIDNKWSEALRGCVGTLIFIWK